MACTPPSTCTISPVVRGNQSDSRATQARAAGSKSDDVPVQRRPAGPDVLELVEARDRLGRRAEQRAGGDQVDPDARRPEVAGQVARGRLERGLGHAHPVVLRPGQRRVEGQADDRAAGRHQRLGRHGKGLERVRRDLQRRRDVGPLGLEEVAAQRRLRGEADRVQHARRGRRRARGPGRRGRRSPPRCSASSSITGGVVGQPLGDGLGDPHGPAEGREHELGALLLGDARDVERDGGLHQHPGHEDPLAVQDAHLSAPFLVRRRRVSRHR